MSLPGTRVVVSFDIDGTLDVGDPAGPISIATVREAKHRGYLVGTCSDRGRRDQRQLLERHGIAVDFASYKYELSALRGEFEHQRCIHIGDSEVDAFYAKRAGFEFWLPHDLPPLGTAGWIL
jgi:FMN phosphatase YigB (HAD superfamily)